MRIEYKGFMIETDDDNFETLPDIIRTIIDGIGLMGNDEIQSKPELAPNTIYKNTLTRTGTCPMCNAELKIDLHKFLQKDNYKEID